MRIMPHAIYIGCNTMRMYMCGLATCSQAYIINVTTYPSLSECETEIDKSRRWHTLLTANDRRKRIKRYIAVLCMVSVNPICKEQGLVLHVAPQSLWALKALHAHPWSPWLKSHAILMAKLEVVGASQKLTTFVSMTPRHSYAWLTHTYVHTSWE